MFSISEPSLTVSDLEPMVPETPLCRLMDAFSVTALRSRVSVPPLVSVTVPSRLVQYGTKLSV